MSREDGFVLRFELIACARCGMQRVRGVTCPDCGFEPAGWEVDQHRLDRERQTAGVLEQLDSDPDAPALSSWSLSEDGLFGDFALLLRNLLSSIRELTQPSGSSWRLRELVGEFVELRALVRRVAHRRPFIAQAHTARTAIAHIEQTLREYLDALTAATPLAAQRHAELAQRGIDATAAALNTLEEQRAEQDEIDTASSSAMFKSMFRGVLAHTGMTFLQLMEQAEQRTSDLLHVDAKSGVEIQLLIAERFAAASMDSVAFEAKYVASYEAFTRRSGALTSLAAATPELLEDFVDAQIDVFNACWAFLHRVQHAQTTRQATEALLDVAVSLVEGPGALLVRTLLLATGVKHASYLKLRDGNATDHLGRAQQEPTLAPLVAGLDAHLRIARSHNLVRYDEDGITATAKRITRRIALDELGDSVIEGLESVLAGTIALRQAYAQANIEIQDLDLLGQLGVAPDDIAEIAVHLMTGQEVEASFDQRTLVVNLASASTFHLTSIAAGLATILRECNDFLIACGHGTDRNELTGSLEVFRNPDKPSSEFATQLQLIRICLALQLNGQPAIGRGQLRKWAATKAVDALSSPDRESFQEVRSLLNLARESQDSELEALMRNCMRWLRLQQGDATTVHALSVWTLSDVDWEAP